MKFAFAPPPAPVLAIDGTGELFPVHRIYCIGRNYAAHAIEMGHDPEREPPFFFQKNPDSLLPSGQAFPYPPGTVDVHHEIELVVALHSGGTNIAIESAMDRVFGYGVGLDMTRRDLQGEAKKMGRPWEIGKAFEHAAPCTALRRTDAVGHPGKEGRIYLEVNGAVRQDGDLAQMIWKVPEMISYLSEYFTLQAGDLIFSGTPAGVGATVKGDQLRGVVEGIGELLTEVV